MKTIVEIEWDEPQEQHWLCPANIKIALSAYCENTKFKVSLYPAQPKPTAGDEAEPAAPSSCDDEKASQEHLVPEAHKEYWKHGFRTGRQSFACKDLELLRDVLFLLYANEKERLSGAYQQLCKREITRIDARLKEG